MLNSLLKKLFPVALGVWVCASLAFSPSPWGISRDPVPNVAARSVIQALESSAVCVVATYMPDVFGSGSGVTFHQKGKTYVLTAKHVVDPEPGLPEPTFTVETYLGGRKQVWKAKVVASGPDLDLAVLEVDTSERPLGGRTSLCLLGIEPGLGSKLLHVGNWLGIMHGSLSEGIISNLDREVEGEHYYQTTVTAYPGSSGGGVWTVDGRLAGLLVRGAGENANLIVPSLQILNWLRDHGFKTS